MFRIPLPKQGHEVLSEGLDNIFKNLMAKRIKEQEMAQQREYQQGQLSIARQAENRAQQLQGPMMQLHLAQAQAATEKANKAKIQANILSGKDPMDGIDASPSQQSFMPQSSSPQSNSMGGGIFNQPSSPSQVSGNQPTSSSSGRTKADMDEIRLGLLGFQAKPEIINGYRVFHNPLTGETTKLKIGPTDAENKYNEAYVKKISNLEDTASAGMQSQPAYAELSNITSNPEFAKMMKHEAAPKLDFAYYNTFGTPAQKDLLAQYKTYGNRVITDSIHKFGSRFTNADLGFLLRQKITDSDSLPSAQGKLKAMRLMEEYATQRSELAAEIMKDALDKGKKLISESKAIKMADEELKGNEIRNRINKEVTGLDPNAKIKFIDSNGDEHTILKKNLGEARKIDENLKVIGE